MFFYFIVYNGDKTEGRFMVTHTSPCKQRSGKDRRPSRFSCLEQQQVDLGMKRAAYYWLMREVKVDLENKLYLVFSVSNQIG